MRLGQDVTQSVDGYVLPAAATARRSRSCYVADDELVRQRQRLQLARNNALTHLSRLLPAELRNNVGAAGAKSTYRSFAVCGVRLLGSPTAVSFRLSD